MTSTTFLCVLVQAATLFAVIRFAGERWFSRVGVQFLGISTVFHGACEIANIAFPRLNFFRGMIDQAAMDGWLLVITGAHVAYAAAYVLGTRGHARKRSPEVSTGNITRVVDARILLALLAPLYLLKVSGRGAADLGYWLGGMIDYLLVLGVEFSLMVFLIQCRGRYLWPALLGEAGAMALLGVRLNIVSGAVNSLTVVDRYGVQKKARSVVVALLAVVALAVTVSASRAVVGRESLAGGTAEARVGALETGVTAVQRQELQTADIARDFVYRCDGNLLGALIYSRLQQGHEPAGWEPIGNDVLVAVPSFLYPQKLSLGIAARNEKAYIVFHYDFEIVDYITTTFVTVFGCFGFLGLGAFAVLWGYALARLDAYLASTVTTTSLLTGLGMTHCVLFMEQGLLLYTETLRAVVTLGLLSAALAWAMDAAKKYLVRSSGAEPSVLRDPRSRAVRT